MIRATLAMLFLLGGATTPARPARGDDVTRAPSPIEASNWPLAAGDTWRYTIERIERRPGEDAVLTDSAEVRVLASWLHGTRRVAVLMRNRPDFDRLDALRATREEAPIAPRLVEVEYQVLETDRLTIIDDPDRLGAVLASTVNAVGAKPEVDAFGEIPLPLSPGRRWGSPEMLARSDGLYVGTAGPRTDLDLPGGQVSAIPVSYQTLPDRDDRWMAPGLGLVRRQYRHRGLDLLETWEMTGFTHEAVDTLALTAHLESRFRLLLLGEGAWSRRSLLPSDPVLTALLGPTALADSPEDDEGIRRLYLRGSGGLVTLERLPDGPGRAWLVTWAVRGLRRHRFAVTADPSSRSNVAGAGLDLAAVHRLAVPASRLSGLSNGAGVVGEAAAAARMELAMQLLVRQLGDAAPTDAAARGSAEAWRKALGAAVGDSVLVTRYGSRIRIDDGDLRVDLEILPGAWAVTARLALPDGRARGGAPRFIRGEAPPIVLSDPGDSSGRLAVRRWLTLNWLADRPGEEVLILSERAAGVPLRLELYQLDATSASRGWTRLLPAGRVRLRPHSGLLDIDSERPDTRLPLAAQHWRETYGPPESPGASSPTPLRRERLDPWLDTGVTVIEALRRRESGPLSEWVRGAGLAVRLASTWLARPEVSIARIDSFQQVGGNDLPSAVAVVTFHRNRAAGPVEAEPLALSFRLVQERGRWVVVDLVADSTVGDWEP
ncbi:MAG: hypothetical protein SGI90_09640 [Candidatus Eisenbacteria bacterium]|nr:hypothetical protein [Candidatus Eisenbacteria bacterium]